MSSSIYGTLNTTLDSLQAQMAGIDTVTNNIANVNTPGYSRQVATLQEAEPSAPGQTASGVSVQSIQSIQDNVLELQLTQENQTQAGLTSYVNAGQQAQGQFNDSAGSGISSSLSGFFSSLQQLSTNPTDTPTRQSVLLAAQNLSQVFNSTASSLSNQQAGLDSSVASTVTQVNTLTSQIATINTSIQEAQGGSSSENTTGALTDQRTELIRQLSSLIGVSVVNTGNGGVTVETPSGSPLVVGNSSVNLTSAVNVSTGHQEVFSQGQDITSSITGGSLGGTLQARGLITGLQTNLDQLASGIANAVNTQNQAGTDMNGAAGGNIFVAPPANGVGAAGSLAVAITDPSKIAASSDGTTGSNGNITAMAALANQNIVNGQPPASAYTSLVSGLGSAISNATSEQTASNLNLQQLQAQRDSISGVNLDEESAMLIQFQRAYQAATQVATVINTLTGDALNLGVSTTV